MNNQAFTDTPLVIDGCEFSSRLIMGSGKFPDNETMVAAWEAGRTEMVTVAIRRIDLSPDRPEKNFADYLDPQKYQILPNSAGCFTADEVVRTARLAREACNTNWFKVEVIGDKKTLLPDVHGTIEAVKELKKDGFVCLCYIPQDVVAAIRLYELGADAIMPLGSPIGSGQGLPDFSGLKFIVEELGGKVPIVVDAGIGAPSDAALAMELGADACLINTAIALAKDPVLMARAMAKGIKAGRMAYLAGRIPKKAYASASSPMEGMVGS
jgi:thiazole synthase